jgi:amidase
MDLAFLPAAEQARRVARREVSSVELVELYLDRIARLDPELNAFVTVRVDEALADARAADASPGDAPFHGVPIAVKDLTATKGVRTTYSSRAFSDFVPDFDTAVVRRLREAGFVLLGKTNTPEFGTTAFTESELNGATRNPWSPERTPGGSSGGAAAALAAGLLPVAHGSDGGGSIRIPASCCGVFGLKPSRGRVSAAPFTSLEGLSTSGPLTRSVEDAAALLDVLAGYEPGDPWWAPPPERAFVEEIGADPGRLRIAVTALPPASDVPVDPECSQALAYASTLLEELGHSVSEATPPWTEPEVSLTFITVWQVGPVLQQVDDLSLLTPLNRELAELADTTSASDYARAVARLQALSRRVVAFWRDYDVVLTPTLALLPVEIGWQETSQGAVAQLLRNTLFTPFTAIANLTGLPAMSLPLHWTADGLPVGVQAIGPPAGEALLLRLAAQVEAARPWAERRPSLA